MSSAGEQGGPARSPGDAVYPLEWEADVVLRDGGTAHIRPIRPEDAAALQRFHRAQSSQSTYLRFFAPLDELPARDLDRFTRVDHVDRVALVAIRSVLDRETDGRDDRETDGRDAVGPWSGGEPGGSGPESGGGPEQIIGVARYDRIGPDQAEVAFNVADAHHGRGLGSVLLEHLTVAGRERGIRRFTAEVLPENGRMLAIFREAGYDVEQHYDDGVVSVGFDIDPTQRSRDVMADREQRAEARSMAGLLRPDSILLVGPDVAAGAARVGAGGTGPPAEERTDSDLARMRRVLSGALHARAGAPERAPVLHAVGMPDTVLEELLTGVPDGVDAVRRWDRLDDIEGPVDMAVLAVPAPAVVTVLGALARCRVRGVILLSGGFAETGPEGLALQRAALRAAHTAGLRVVGPRSFGLFVTDPEAPVNASLAPQLPAEGPLGLFCQSASAAATVLAAVGRRGLGIASFVSAGHRADVSGNDLMQYWQEDPRTRVVGLYLESIGNPRKFSRIARRLAGVKPVVVVAAGRSGQIVPPGHAVRRPRVPRRALEEMLRQSGVIRADDIHQMLDISALLAHQPLPRGPRVAVVASSAALGALVAELAGSAELVVAGPPEVVPEDAPADEVREALRAVYERDDADAVVVVRVSTLGAGDDAFAAALSALAARSRRPTAASILGLRMTDPRLRAEDGDGVVRQVPAYSTPEDAVLSLAAAVRHARWREADRGQAVRPPDVDPGRARALVARSQGELAPGEVADLLAAYGVGVLPSTRVATADQAVRAADALGWPVVLKTTDEALRHRADLGGVRLGIADEAELRAAVAEMGRGVGLPLEIQHMVPHGVSCVIGSVEDPSFGPVVSFGMSGDATELLDDVGYGIPPLTDVDVAALVRSVRAAPRLFGYRGLPPMDVAALEDLLVRVSVMADDLPELERVRLDPVVVGERGATVAGARIRLAPARRADALRRALPQQHAGAPAAPGAWPPAKHDGSGGPGAGGFPLG